MEALQRAAGPQAPPTSKQLWKRFTVPLIFYFSLECTTIPRGQRTVMLLESGFRSHVNDWVRQKNLFTAPSPGYPRLWTC